ncbi:MAG: potassium channel family protein [Acidimicrobiales bacterium]
MADDTPELGPVRRRLHERLLEDQAESATLARPMFPVFVLTLMGVFLSPVLSDWRWGRTVTVIIIGGSAALALERSGAHRGVRPAAGGTVAVVALFIAVVPAVDEYPVLEEIVTALFALLLMVTPVVVIGRLLMRPKITLDTVAASLAGYLQIGLLFASVYSLVSQIETVPFFATGSDLLSTFDFQYFSFITLTTVGYGDLTPATNAGRSLAMLEAVVGQVFLVTIVAVVVGNIGRDLPHRRGTTTPDDGDA